MTAAFTAYGLAQEFGPRDTGWRTFPHHYLLYAASGTFHVDVAAKLWLLPPHRAAWIAAEVPVRIHTHAPVTCCSVLFAPGFLVPPTAGCAVFSVAPLAREMIRYAMRWDRPRPEPDLRADRFFLALADVCLDLAAAPAPSWLPRPQSPELERAMAHTLATLDAPPSFVDAAQAAALSERTLARRFVAETQMTWRQFVQRARMVRAMELLAADSAPVIEVAQAVGFASVSAFSTTFRDFTAETPTQFRRRLQPQ